MVVSSKQAMDWLKRHWKIVLAVVVILSIWMAWRHLTSTPIGRHASKIADQPAAVAIQLGSLTEAVKRSPFNAFGLMLLVGLGAVGVLGLSSKKGRAWMKSAKESVTKALKSGVDELEPDTQKKYVDTVNEQADGEQAKSEGRLTQDQQTILEDAKTRTENALDALAESKENANRLRDAGDEQGADDAEEAGEDEFDDSFEDAPLEPVV